MKTTKKQTSFKQAYSFARNNGYLYAHYKLEKDNNYYLRTYDFMADSDYNFTVDTRAVLSGIDFKVLQRPDKKDVFVLHNTYSLPEKQDFASLAF